MTRVRGAVLGVALLGVAAIGANVLPSAAQQQPQPIASEPLTGRAVFPDDVDLKLKVKLHGAERLVVKAKNPSRTFVAQFTVQPGAQFPWHTHPGPVIVNVTEGELVYVAADDCVQRSYRAGTAFVDPGHGHVHTAYNPTGAPTVLIPADAPDDCEV
jgi:quercetin dioxygenase-like cupin family protein